MQYKRKINRDYSKPFFNRRRSWFRFYFIVSLLIIIGAIPVVAFWQADRIQYATLDYLGYAPTATPFASDYAMLAQDFYLLGDTTSAAYHYQLATQQQPENVNYLYELGRVLIELDQNDAAFEIGERMIALAPDDVRGYALKALSVAWDNPTVALPAAIEGRDIDNTFAPIHSALSIAYTRIGRYQEALREGDLAIRIDPMDASARRSYTYSLIYTGNYSEAIRQLELAVSINPNVTGPYFELASLYRNALINRPEQAVQIYLAVLEREPTNARAYLRLCETYAAAGLFQEADFYCSNALELQPDYADAHATAGQIRYSRRNYEGAIEEFELCLGLTPNFSISDPDYNLVDIRCLYIRGLAHYFLGNENCDPAWTWLNIAVSHPQAQGPVLEAILTGLRNTTINCAGFQGRALPTPVPPTPIPPTPIGGY